MRKHARPIAVAAGLLVGGATVGIAADAAVAKRGKSAKRDPTVHVIEHAVTDTVVQSGGGKDVTGNTLTFHNKVYDTADKKQVGTDQGFCIRISPADGSWECFWTTFLARGQITVEGPYYDNQDTSMAVTGGTGIFLSVQGECRLHARDPQRTAFDWSCTLIY